MKKESEQAWTAGEAKAETIANRARAVRMFAATGGVVGAVGAATYYALGIPDANVTLLIGALSMSLVGVKMKNDRLGALGALAAAGALGMLPEAMNPGLSLVASVASGAALTALTMGGVSALKEWQAFRKEKSEAGEGEPLAKTGAKPRM